MTKNISIDKIHVLRNDRTAFDPVKLQELADNIQQQGLLNPITVQIIDISGKPVSYNLIAGERRLRACRLLGYRTIDATVLDVTPSEASTMMLAENVSRSDLDPVDEGYAYQDRINRFGWTAYDCAKKAGVSFTRVQFRLKLCNLRIDLQDLVRSGNLELGYAGIIAGSGLDPNYQVLAFRALRDNPNPSPAWFRRIVGDLSQKAQSAILIEDPLFSGKAVEMPQVTPTQKLPPTPATSRPPVAKIPEQIHFWKHAATEWDRLGKNFKRDECLAAVAALTYALPDGAR